MKIKINRFCLRHEEKTYKKGDIVEIANEETAKMIVANSGGDFSIYHPEDEDVATPPATPLKNAKEDGAGKENGTEKKGPEEGTTGGGTDKGGEDGLPDPDFDGSVNP